MTSSTQEHNAAADDDAALQHIVNAQLLAADVPELPAPGPGSQPSRVGVIGSGTMGGGIAISLANIGISATVVDRDDASLTRGLERVAANYAASVKRGKLEQSAMDQRMALIEGTTDFGAIAGADVIIEAAFEEIDVKRDVFRQLDEHAKPDAVLATNTSALDIDVIAAATNRPDAVVGAHFFNPANVMRLLEVVRGAQTKPQVIADMMQLGRSMGKTAVLSGNAPGFIGNAMLFEYHREAMFLIEDGALPAQVDRVLREFGWAMGLFEMTDMAGHDIAVESRRREIETRPKDRRYSDIQLLLVDLGRLGQKSGAGWYRYTVGDRRPQPDGEMDERIIEYSASLGITRRQITDEEILKRCLYPMINRAARLLADGVALKPSDIDIVYVTGYGFPPKRGGPLYWADQIGVANVLADIERFHGDHGLWWEPAPLLKELAESNRSFAGLQQQTESA